MVIAVAHLTIAATWLGSMVYSLVVVQPRIAQFFTDESRREAFLLAVAHGNRWKVAPVVGALVLSGVVMIATSPRVAAGYAVATIMYAAAAAIFVNVSWRHWPARVFALPDELAGFRSRLQIQAWTMLGLVTVAFVIVLSASIGAGSR
jgi:hypothetical protein